MLEATIDIVNVNDGEDGLSQGVLTSFIFVRSNTAPAAPAAGLGSFTEPNPPDATQTGSGWPALSESGGDLGYWSDSAPDGSSKLWMSRRIFTSDGLSPQEDAWSAPAQMTDTADIDICFNSSETQPDAPTVHGEQNGEGGWYDEADSTSVWMAVCKQANGEWGDWEISKIKGEKGEDGVAAIRLDLDNENDAMLYDGAGTLVSGSVTSQATLYAGVTAVDASDVTWGVTNSGCTATVSSGKVTVTALSATSATVTVKATYNGATYTAVLSLKKLVGVDKYDIVLSANSVSVDVNNSNALSPTSVTVGVYRTAQNGSRALQSTLTSGHSLTCTPYGGTETALTYSGGKATIAPSASVTSYTVTLYDADGYVLDCENIPVLKDGTNGEKGADGTDGTDGEDGVTLILTPDPVELAIDEETGKVSADATCTITYKAGATSGAVTDIKITGVSHLAVTNPQVWVSDNAITVPTSSFGTQAVTWTDADGNTQSKDIAYGSYYVDFTCTCGTLTGVPGRMLMQAAVSAMWGRTFSNSEKYESIYTKLYGTDGDIAALQTKISQNAEAIELKASSADLTTVKTALQSDIDGVESTANAAQTAAENAQTAAENAASEVATMQASVSALEVEADKISAKTRKYNGINILAADSAGKEDSTNTSADITASGTKTLTFYLRKAVTKGNTYRFHAELASQIGGSKATYLRLRYGSSTILASAITSSTSLSAGVAYYNADFTATADYAAGTVLYVYLYVGTVASGDTVTLLNCALLYDLEQYMLDTGFDIFGHTFQVTADNFIVLNNEGVRNLYLDTYGNLIVRGAVNNDTLWIDANNISSYLLSCPASVGEVAASRSGNIVYSGGSVTSYCLDLFRVPSVVVLANNSTYNGFLLPSASGTGGFCRTKTTYLSDAARWLTFADMRMLVGRSFTFINQGCNIMVGLGAFYYVEDGISNYTPWGNTTSGQGTAIMLKHGEFITVTMRLDANYGYIWEIEGAYTGANGTTVESLFAGSDDNWNVPDQTSLTLGTYMTPSGGTSLTSVYASRSYSYLNGSTWTSGTLRFSRCSGGTITTGSSSTFGLVAGDTSTALTGGMKLRVGARTVAVKFNNGYYPSTSSTTWYYIGVRLILWSVSGSACGAWAQSPRFNVDGNIDMLNLDLTEIFDDWDDSTQYYLAINVETATTRPNSGNVTAAFTMEQLGLEVVEY